MCDAQAESPTRGIVHNSWEGLKKGTFASTGEKTHFPKFRVEKREGTPYAPRSYLPGGAASENRAARRQVIPPCSLGDQSREEHAVDLNLL